MTALARFKEEPVDPDLHRLGELVVALRDRCAPLRDFAHDPAQRAWPETVALTRSIEEDEGWELYATDRGKMWQVLTLYLFAPQVFLRSYRDHLEVVPGPSNFPYTVCKAVLEAKNARAQRIGRKVPLHTPAIQIDLRARRWAQWGRS